ncbi:hypothetical protein [Bradyrhizobium cenepequi]|uniref:hypothetical protein n=1 Tax=Bradyrhizobium cenepequi TaxID=2821403 RepID=UPI001CE308B8|nr:hypothetical protein [Bradyrhizobium cenepequi]MCA6111615.1 hypothetical protein [Bradyrhizobium cenepequi]
MASERFAYRIWYVIEDERQLLFMFNASDMIDAMHMAADFLEEDFNPARIEVERAGCAIPALDSDIIIEGETSLEIVFDQYDLAKGKLR